jgi:hypothetical protein
MTLLSAAASWVGDTFLNTLGTLAPVWQTAVPRKGGGFILPSFYLGIALLEITVLSTHCNTKQQLTCQITNHQCTCRYCVQFGAITVAEGSGDI